MALLHSLEDKKAQSRSPGAQSLPWPKLMLIILLHIIISISINILILKILLHNTIGISIYRLILIILLHNTISISINILRNINKITTY